ncbi:MAG: flagellar export chaperone FlgN [Candidatus Eisenbacteria bacterium]
MMGPGAFESLITAIRRETALAQDLRAALADQRGAIASNDAEKLLASLDAVEKTLLTLAEARTLRTEIMASLTGDPKLPLGQLESLRREPLPFALDDARRELKRAATAVRDDVRINQAILTRAVENGEAFLQALFTSALGPVPTYADAERAPEPKARPGMILNRRA